MSAQRADKIIAISETTKRDLLTYLEVDESKVEVIYHGIDIKTPLKLEKVKDLPSSYLFFVGDRSGYKNFYLMLNAFAALSKKHPDLHLVLSGGGNLVGAEIEIITRLKLQDSVHHYNVTDEQLNYLYSHALLFVYPSLYEGFGLPLLEAMNMECPVICSDIGSFSEIVNDAAIYFDPTDMESISFKMEKLIFDDQNNIKPFV